MGAVAIMIQTSLCPFPLVMKENVHGHLISLDLPVHPDPLIGLLTFPCYYGPHDKRTRATCIPHVHQRIRRGALVSDDYNATTRASDESTLTSNIRPWLAGVEKKAAVTDPQRSFHPYPPYTRCCRYRGTQSCIDGMYASKTFLSLFTPSLAKVCDFSGVPGAQDHDLVVDTLHNSGKIEVLSPQYGTWNRCDLKRYRQLMDDATPSLPSMHAYSDIEPCLVPLREKMLDSMNIVNAQKGEPPRKTHGPHQE